LSPDLRIHLGRTAGRRLTAGAQVIDARLGEQEGEEGRGFGEEEGVGLHFGGQDSADVETKGNFRIKGEA
jgi:hypothetical protein